MRLPAVSGIALLCCSLPACTAQVSSPQTALPSLVRSFLAAEQAYDVPALSKLIRDDYVEVSPAGEVDQHDRFLGFYTPDKRQTWPQMTLSDEQVRTFGNTAIEIAKQSYTMAGPDGQMHTREIRCTFVAQEQGGTLKLIDVQYTGIRPVPVAPPKPQAQSSGGSLHSCLRLCRAT